MKTGNTTETAAADDELDCCSQFQLTKQDQLRVSGDDHEMRSTICKNMIFQMNNTDCIAQFHNIFAGN